MSSRILSRNSSKFVAEVREVMECSLPHLDNPLDSRWEWPRAVNTPFKYGWFVARLHKARCLDMIYPPGAFQRFASRFDYLGYETLTRAACLAAKRAQHPFSPKFVERLLDQVPSSEVLPTTLF